MNVQNLMLDIMKWSETLKERSVTRDVYTKEKDRFIELKNKLSLKRDQLAISNLIGAVGKRMIFEWICLAYVYDGELYSVAMSHRCNPPDGILSTELLIGKLTSDEWDKLEKRDIWIHSGKQY